MTPARGLECCTVLLSQVVGRMKADAILGGAAALVAQGFPDSADNLLQHHRDLTDDCAPQAATRARLLVFNAQVLRHRTRRRHHPQRRSLIECV